MTTRTISTDTNDCTALSSGGFSNSQTYFFLGQQSAGVVAEAWIPFVVQLSKGKVITSATLKLIAEGSSSATTVKVKIGCEAADNPATPTTQADLLARVLSTAYLTDNNVAAWTAGNEYTFDVTTAVQEILNRAGWARGNTLAVLVRDNGSSSDVQRSAASFDNATYTEPKLEIVYPGSGQVIIWSSQ